MSNFEVSGKFANALVRANLTIKQTKCWMIARAGGIWSELIHVGDVYRIGMEQERGEWKDCCPLVTLAQRFCASA